MAKKNGKSGKEDAFLSPIYIPSSSPNFAYFLTTVCVSSFAVFSWILSHPVSLWFMWVFFITPREEMFKNREIKFSVKKPK